MATGRPPSTTTLNRDPRRDTKRAEHPSRATDRPATALRPWVLIVFACGAIAIGLVLGAGLLGAGGSVHSDGPPSSGLGHEMPVLSDTDLTSDRGSGSLEGSASAMLTLDTPVPEEAVVLLASYTRFNDVSPLEHDLRSEILGIVAALPGLYMAQLVTRIDRPTSTVRYHTRILERENELKTARVSGNLRIYPADTDPDAYAVLAAMRDPATARVIETVQANAPVTVGQLAALVERAPSTVSHHLSRLEETGVIERTRNGESVIVTLSEWSTALDLDAIGRPNATMPQS